MESKDRINLYCFILTKNFFFNFNKFNSSLILPSGSTKMDVDERTISTIQNLYYL